MSDRDCARDLAIVYDVSYPFVDGGGQRRLFEVAVRLVERGWNVTWYTTKTWRGGVETTHRGIRYVGLDADSELYTPTGRRSIREALSFGVACWKARRRIRRHSHLWCGLFPYFHLYALLLGRKRRFLIDWWEAWGMHWLSYLGPAGAIGAVVESIAARVFSRAGVLITPSEMTKSDLLRIGAAPDSVITIPLGVSLADVGSVPPATERCQIVYAGRLKDHKNVDHILHAAHLLRHQHGLVVSCGIVGDGPEAPRLKDLAASLGLNSQVRFWGVLPDREMFAVVKAADIFIHPSTKEGGGSVTLIEANACGTPVLIYRHPAGIDPSMVREGTNGWIVDGIGPEHLAVAISDFYSTGMVTRFDREACAREVGANDWSQITERYQQVLLAAG